VFAILMTMALLAIVVERQVNPSGVLLRGRSFYGTYSVRDLADSHTRALFHGNTLHGSQSLLPEHRREALSYYGPQSPVAEIFRERVGRSERVAVLGLGAGVILSYAQPGSTWTIYEIDPAIARLAQTPALFSYWADTAGSPVLVIGDGRVRLRDAADASYDLIVADAFASDSVPVHLLTREAMALYFSKLRNGGVVLFNVSNRYLDLAPAIGATAARLGLVAYEATDRTKDEVAGLFSSQWVVVGHSTMTPPAERWALVTAPADDQGWTDDHSNVFATLRAARVVREKISNLFGY
jgi:hypothetical protein